MESNRTERTNEWERRVRVGDGGRATERETSGDGSLLLLSSSGVVVVVASRSKEEEEEEIKPGCCVWN
jgi:hypothetical protein